MGKSSMDIPEPALRFALDFFAGLGRQNYYETDAADCLALARKLSRFAQVVSVEERVIAALESFRSALTEACSFRDSLRDIAGAVGRMAMIEERMAELETKPARPKRRKSIVKARPKPVAAPKRKKKEAA